MKTAIAVLCFVAGATAFPGNAVPSRGLPVSRIVNGTDTTIDQFPWQISLQRESGHSCGGSILSENYILTAAHCVDDNNPSALSVVANSTIWSGDDGAQRRRVSDVMVTRQWDSSRIVYDYAVLKLSEPLDLVEGGVPRRAKLGLANMQDPSGMKCKASGWGSTIQTRPPAIPTILKMADVDVISDDNCKRIWGNNLADVDAQICTMTLNPPNSICFGDSGGPLVCEVENDDGEMEWMQFGIASFVGVTGGLSCVQSLPNAWAQANGVDSNDGWGISWINEQCEGCIRE